MERNVKKRFGLLLLLGLLAGLALALFACSWKEKPALLYFQSGN